MRFALNRNYWIRGFILNYTRFSPNPHANLAKIESIFYKISLNLSKKKD